MRLVLFSLILIGLATRALALAADGLPDIRSIPVDLEVPPLSEQKAAPGVRVKSRLEGHPAQEVYHVLFLPHDWQDDGTRYPVIVEFAGNGGFTSPQGDVSTGRPEGSCLGYGLTAGEQCIWLCLPYLTADGSELALQWWGDAPQYDPQTTLKYLRATIDMVCEKYRGDNRRILLCGFSRGAIACNYLGLYDDETADIWCGFLAYSHYDGLRSWPFTPREVEPAAKRLERLGSRPQFICGEGNGSDAVGEYLRKHAPDANVTLMSTGFRNHSDAWILRPSPAREAARAWLNDLFEQTPAR